MSKFVIQGPTKPLKGEVKAGGSKNAVLPILAASLLATEPVTLTNVPAIRDVTVMLSILEEFGMKVDSATPGTVVLDPSGLQQAEVPHELARSLRASILLLGPAVSRFGEYASVHPGGDVIGKRPLDTHFHGLEALGAKVTKDHATYHVTAKHLKGQTIFLEEASVTATENIIMAAALAQGTTIIKNAASELHVRDLAAFLNTLGAEVTGAGTNKVRVEGVKELTGGNHAVRADEIEAATFLVAAGVTGGDIEVTGIDPEHFGTILLKLQQAGLNLDIKKTSVRAKAPHKLVATDIKTGLWPSFPSDLQSPYTVLMTQAEGVSIIHDWLYEGRFYYTDKLANMGANITMADPHRIIVFGPTKLRGAELESPDIRAGITLVVAALVADGETVIDHAELIDRGYERIDERLAALGADIKRVE